MYIYLVNLNTYFFFLIYLFIHHFFENICIYVYIWKRRGHLNPRCLLL